MVQNHMLQLLCLVAMEPPAALDADAVRDEKLKVLRALRPIGERDVGDAAPCAASTAPAPSTARRCRAISRSWAAPTATTETFVALKAEIDNWRWAGVPFYLRTGKRLPARVSEIVIQFQPVPHSIFPQGAGAHRAQPAGHPPAAGRGHQAAS